MMDGNTGVKLLFYPNRPTKAGDYLSEFTFQSSILGLSRIHSSWINYMRPPRPTKSHKIRW